MAADHKEITDWTLDQLHVQDHNHVLDIGCGSGMAIKKINTIINHGYIVGIDYSLLMLRQAVKRNKLIIKKRNVALCHGNVSALPFADNTFDKVCAIETFYFWPNAPENLLEVKRILKPGGTAAFTMEISKDGTNRSKISDNAQRLGFPIYSGEEMKSLLATAGFVSVSYKSIPERGKGWLCAIGSVQKI
jgi:ubiquinone/menaquinone biosynthesis C-methylase UbiE